MSHKFKISLPVLAIIVGIAGSSFTTTHPVNEKVKKAALHARADQQWFVYSDGADNIASNITEARNTSNYTPAGQNPEGCQGTDNLCAIFTDTDTNGQPVITPNQGVDNELQDYFNSSGTTVGQDLLEKPEQ